MLDTLYGGGPTACPIAFEPAGYMVDYRTQSALAKVGDAATLGPTAQRLPYRDLARLKPGHRRPAEQLRRPSQVYVADERSDDNTLLSQVVVLFSIVHNAIAGKLANLGAQASFAHASTAVMAMYYAIIRYDLMPKLLLDQVYEPARPYRQQSGWAWRRRRAYRLEFAHGAFRVGHAMVRPFYQFNTGKTGHRRGARRPGPLGDPVRDPLPSTWIVEWSRFFALGGIAELQRQTGDASAMPLDFVGIFQPVAANSPEHLTIRDWLSAANARMWRLDKLISAAKTSYPESTSWTARRSGNG